MPASADVLKAHTAAADPAPRKFVSGAAVVGGALTIATLGKAADGEWYVDSDRSAQFKLCGRDQDRVLSFYSEVSHFISAVNISELFLRVGPRGGPLSGVIESHVCEATLCLGPARVHQVSAFSIASRMRVAELEFRGQKDQRAWQYAVAAACVGAEERPLRTHVDPVTRAAIRSRSARA